MSQRAPTTPAQPSIAHSATRLLMAGLVVLALVPPLATLAAGLQIARNGAGATALAWAHSSEGTRADSAAVARGRLPDMLGDDPRGQWLELLDRDGALLVSGGDARARDGLTVRSTVQLAGRPTAASGDVAAVRVGSSLDSVLWATALVAALSAAASALVWVLLVQRSVGALRLVEGRLRSSSLLDPLTGLLNHAGMRLRLQRALDADLSSATRRACVLLIDLDRFRLINESLGQPAGDELLRAVAARIRGVLGPGDAAARMGADQFVLHARAVAGPRQAAVMARNLLRAIEPALTVGERETQISVSIGIALAGPDAGTADLLLAHADAAMRAAKAGGGGRHRVFDPSLGVDTQQQLELELALRRAVQAGDFELAYQPIVHRDGERIVAVEALVRWNDVQRGVVAPGDFIPILEQTGLIVPVGNWVLREACRRAQGWIAHGAPAVVLSVNVSPIQFAEPDFVHHVQSALKATGFPATLLQLEVTEGLLLDPTAASLDKMDALVDAGVRLAIDDFGMGYSSLAYLKRFRLHSLKIDRMFVRDVPARQQDTAIVRAIVELAHALELDVTAEGVETNDQLEALSALGCDSMQGYLFARPMAAEQMGIMLGTCMLQQGSMERAADWSTTMAARLDLESQKV